MRRKRYTRRIMIDPADEIDATEAARILKKSRALIGQLIRQGRLGARKVGPRCLILSRKEVEAFAKQERGPGIRMGKRKKKR